MSEISGCNNFGCRYDNNWLIWIIVILIILWLLGVFGNNYC